jgi:hypothetical protein
MRVLHVRIDTTQAWTTGGERLLCMSACGLSSVGHQSASVQTSGQPISISYKFEPCLGLNKAEDEGTERPCG